MAGEFLRTTEGKDCIEDATLLPLTLLLEWILCSILSSCARLSASKASSNNCSSCNSNDFSNNFSLRWNICLHCSANNLVNSDVIHLLKNMKYVKVATGVVWIIIWNYCYRMIYFKILNFYDYDLG